MADPERTFLEPRLFAERWSLDDRWRVGVYPAEQPPGEDPPAPRALEEAGTFSSEEAAAAWIAGFASGWRSFAAAAAGSDVDVDDELHRDHDCPSCSTICVWCTSCGYAHCWNGHEHQGFVGPAPRPGEPPLEPDHAVETIEPGEAL